MCCKDAILPEPLFTNCTIKCLTYEESTRQPYNDSLCIFRALVLSLHANQRREEDNSKFFNSFINRMDGLCPNLFKGVHMNNITDIEVLLTLNVLLYGINGNGNFIEGIA